LDDRLDRVEVKKQRKGTAAKDSTSWARMAGIATIFFVAALAATYFAYSRLAVMQTPVTWREAEIDALE